MTDKSSDDTRVVDHGNASLVPILNVLDDIKTLSQGLMQDVDTWESDLAEGNPAHLSANLEVTRARISALLSGCDDIKFLEVHVTGANAFSVLIIHIESLVDRTTIQQNMVKPLRSLRPTSDEEPASRVDQVDNTLSVFAVRRAYDIDTVVHSILTGDTALLVDGDPVALVCDTRGWDKRTISEPMTETSIVGPHEAFIENFQTNLGMIRRYVPDPALKVNMIEVGTRSKTKLAILYIEDIARAGLVAEIQERIKNIEHQTILNTNYVAELLEGKRFALFPLMRRTSRPDIVASSLYEGRVALVMASPQVMIAPGLLMDFMTSPDDYYLPPVISILLRIVRLLGVFIVVFLPALYVAVAAYNPDVLPVEFMQSIAENRAGIPTTVLLELVFMEAMMELLQEASVRLPMKIGAIATVFGGLILGQAAAAARIISNLTVIIVAMTATGSFVIPSYEVSLAWRVSKWLVVVGAALFGLYGIGVLMFVLLIYLNSLSSFGTPYLAPVAPPIGRGLRQDLLWRAPWWAEETRKKSITAAPQPERGPS